MKMLAGVASLLPILLLAPLLRLDHNSVAFADDDSAVVDSAVVSDDGYSAAAPNREHSSNDASQQQDFDERALARLESPPLGLPPVSIPADNRVTLAKISLGRKLFFDRRLSVNNTMSCAICHVPEQGFTNNELARPLGVEGRSLKRSAPTILNVAYANTLFHDGRAASLEEQATAPLLAREEMANPTAEALIARVLRLPDYDGRFEQAFNAGPSLERIGQAIASWERTVLAGNSPFDRWRYGNQRDALTAQQQHGFELFTGKARCATCHTIGDKHALFSDGKFHNTGIGYLHDIVERRQTAPVPVEIAPGVVVAVEREIVESVGHEKPQDTGRHEVTQRSADRWRYKTPSLRNVAVTAPYMHDGSIRSLPEIVRYYNTGGAKHDGLSTTIQPLGLSDNEQAALVAFLRSLTSDDLAELQTDARSVPVGN